MYNAMDALVVNGGVDHWSDVPSINAPMFVFNTTDKSEIIACFEDCRNDSNDEAGFAWVYVELGRLHEPYTSRIAANILQTGGITLLEPPTIITLSTTLKAAQIDFPAERLIELTVDVDRKAANLTSGPLQLEIVPFMSGLLKMKGRTS